MDGIFFCLLYNWQVIFEDENEKWGWLAARTWNWLVWLVDLVKVAMFVPLGLEVTVPCVEQIHSHKKMRNFKNWRFLGTRVWPLLNSTFDNRHSSSCLFFSFPMVKSTIGDNHWLSECPITPVFSIPISWSQIISLSFQALLYGGWCAAVAVPVSMACSTRFHLPRSFLSAAKQLMYCSWISFTSFLCLIEMSWLIYFSMSSRNLIFLSWDYSFDKTGFRWLPTALSCDE